MLESDICYWCELSIARPNKMLPWIDQDGDRFCLFHPANWNETKMESTKEYANHQTGEQVCEIIREDYFRNLALRERTPLRAVTDNVVVLSKKAQRTSRMVAEKVLPRTGSLRHRVYMFYQARGIQGATDEEAQELLGIDGNTMRPTRGSLVDDGYLYDSGVTRLNSKGHECIVWIHSDNRFMDTLFG